MRTSWRWITNNRLWIIKFSMTGLEKFTLGISGSVCNNWWFKNCLFWIDQILRICSPEIGGIQRPKNSYLGKSKLISREPRSKSNPIPRGEAPRDWIRIDLGSRDEVWIFQGMNSLVVGYTFQLSTRRILIMKMYKKIRQTAILFL